MEDVSLFLAGWLVVLGAIIFLRQRRRSKPPWEAGFDGHAIDVLSLSCRVRRARQDYLGELHGRAHRRWRRGVLLAQARHSIKRLRFFRRAGKKIGRALGQEEGQEN